MMLIPVFRKPSYRKKDVSILIRPVFCTGLRYDVYATPTNLRKDDRYRVIRRIGRVSKRELRDEITTRERKSSGKLIMVVGLVFPFLSLAVTTRIHEKTKTYYHFFKKVEFREKVRFQRKFSCHRGSDLVQYLLSGN